MKLNYDGYKSQIDIIAITKKNVYILESKNLKGNIDVQKDGTMIRKSKFGRRGFKNPVTQTSKHEELLKDILKNEKVKTKLTFWTVLTNDSSFIKSDLSNKVMRNDKLILNMKKKESKKHIVRKEEGIKKLCDTILKYEVKEGDYSENI